MRDQDKSFIRKLFATKRVKYLGLICKIELTLALTLNLKLNQIEKVEGLKKSVRGLSDFETRNAKTNNQKVHCKHNARK